MTSTVSNQLPPRTTTSHRWPRKWATLGGRGSPSTSIPSSNINDSDFTEKTNGHINGNGHHHHQQQHRYSTSLFRKSSTISRTNGGTTINNSDLNNETPSLKKSRSLINVLRSKLNSPAVLRRFRTKSRENSKQIITEINHDDKNNNNDNEKISTQLINDDNNNHKKIRKRDPSPMKRFTSRLAQLTRSSTHTSIENEQHNIRKSSSPSPPIHNNNKDQVDHINACYDEIRAKYFDNNNNNTKQKNHISQYSNVPLTNERFKDILSTTTASSIEYYERQNNDIHNRSLSTISMNGSLLSHDFLNNSQQFNQSLTPITSDDPLLQARKQSNIKLNCMLSGYGFTTPFGNHEKILGQNDLFKFHHYHDVGKRKFDFNFTNNNNRMYSSLRTRPMSRSIDSFRRATTTIENEIIPTNSPVEPDNNFRIDDENFSNNSIDNELVIREDGDIIESESKVYSSKVHVTPAVSLHVKTFISSSSNVPDENKNILNDKSYDEHNDEFERNFLRAVDRALGVVNNDENDLLQTVYDIPMKTDNSNMNLMEITERALSTFNNTNIFMDNERKNEPMDDEHCIDGAESPNVELFDRTGELFDTENVHWQASAVYDDQPPITNHVIANCNDENSIDDHVWSIVDDLTRKTDEFLLDEPSQNGQQFLALLDNEEKTIKSKADSYNKLLQTDDSRLNDDVRSDINAVIGEVNLLLRGKLKQFRGLCQANVSKSRTPAGEPTPLDSDLEGFWDITYPLIDKVKIKFTKLDTRKAKQWASIEDEYDPNDVNNRPRIIDERLKQLQPHQNKSKISTTKSAHDDLKKLIQERRKAAANVSNTTNQNHDVEIFVTHK
ncbi:unnamed protein product [Rotaria sordida]|uniref:Uncharacterized protein n=1 Tax=Rotaria sordida TaxID=392033 RepID=A0A815HUX9_9BILA|nr:unnamed protein product [Rotaria sordida]